MRQKLILIMGILSILFGCDKREPLGGHYYLNEKENIIFTLCWRIRRPSC